MLPWQPTVQGMLLPVQHAGRAQPLQTAADDANVMLLLQVYEAQHAVHRVALSHLDNDAVKALVDGVCQRWHQFAQPGQYRCGGWLRAAQQCCIRHQKVLV